MEKVKKMEGGNQTRNENEQNIHTTQRNPKTEMEKMIKQIK